MINHDLTAQEVAEKVAAGELDLSTVPAADPQKLYDLLGNLSDEMLAHIRSQREIETLFLRNMARVVSPLST